MFSSDLRRGKLSSSSYFYFYFAIFTLWLAFSGCSPRLSGEVNLSQSGTSTIQIEAPSPSPSLSPSPSPTLATADFFHLAIVPDQTVTSSTFLVEVIAENISPHIPPTAPVLIDDGGGSHQMLFRTLKWPGTADDSITIYSKSIPLSPDKKNTIKVISGTKEIDFSITHKAVLNKTTASNATDLITKVKAGLSNPAIDIVEIDYDETDLGSVLHNIGSGVTNNRSTWLTIRPSPTRAVSWNRDSGTSTQRPLATFLNLDGITFGSDTSDGGGGHFYTEREDRVWLSNTEFRGKYKSTWNKTTPMTSTYYQEIRSISSEGQKIYFTDCAWDGTASVTATSSAELARDLIFNSHRGDFNNFGKVFLNVLAKDVSPVRNSTDTDYLHNDGFQVWGNSGADNLAFKGFKIISPNISADIQPFHIGQTYVPNYSYLLIDNIIIEGSNTGLNAQLGGVMNNSRVSNLTFTEQTMTIRQDFDSVTYPNGAFSPSNVQVSNLNVKKVVLYPSSGSAVSYDYNSVADANDISNELSAMATLAGANFSSVKVKPMPTDGTFSPYQAANPRYRSDSGGLFINTIGLSGLTSIMVSDQANTSGLLLNFTSTANRDIYLADTRMVRLVVTVVNQGKLYVWSC